MKWFRFWTDSVDDVKLLQLSDYEYRMWTYILCYASEIDSSSGQLQITFKLLSLHFHQRFNLFSRAVETFQKLGLITVDEQGYPTITNWSKRQFKSDRVTDRVHKFRASQPGMKRFRNGIETAPDTDTDTEKEKKNIKKKEKSIQPEKIKYLDAVLLTVEEHQKLINKYGSLTTDKAIEILNNGIMAKGYKYKSHYHAVIGWPMKEALGGGNGKGTYAGRTDIRGHELPDESERINAEYYARKAAKEAAANKALGKPKGNDVPDFQSA